MGWAVRDSVRNLLENSFDGYYGSDLAFDLAGESTDHGSWECFGSAWQQGAVFQRPASRLEHDGKALVHVCSLPVRCCKALLNRPRRFEEECWLAEQHFSRKSPNMSSYPLTYRAGGLPFLCFFVYSLL